MACFDAPAVLRWTGYAALGTTVLYCLDSVRKGLCHGKPQVMCRDDDEQMAAILAPMKSLKRRYFPTFWAHGAYTQFIALLLWKALHRGSLPYERHVLKCPDGGQVAVKVFDPPGHLPDDTPIVLILHTICGTVEDEAEFAKYAFSRGFRPIFLCRRGHFEGLTSPNFNIMGNTDDTHMMVEFVKKMFPNAFMGAVGLSAGSGQIVSYIGQQRRYHGEGEPLSIEAAVSLCPAYSIDTAFDHFHATSPLLAQYILQGLKDFFLNSNQQLLGDMPGYHRAVKSASIPEFISHSVQMTGHDTFDEFIDKSNPMSHYRGNEVPCLILNAADDPLCVEQNIPYDIASDAENYALVMTRCGSHVAYREGVFGQSSYMHEVALDFLESARDVLRAKAEEGE